MEEKPRGRASRDGHQEGTFLGGFEGDGRSESERRRGRSRNAAEVGVGMLSSPARRGDGVRKEMVRVKGAAYSLMSEFDKSLSDLIENIQNYN